MSQFFLDLGFSWTMSKVLPFLLFFVIGFVLFFAFRKKLKKGLLRGLFSLMVVFPVGIYFAFSPIYEGDFSNNYRQAASPEGVLGVQMNAFTVIAIPNCPYCAESIERLNTMVKRTGSDNVNFIVLSSDVQSINSYKLLGDKKIDMSIDTNFRAYESLTLGRYPTFIYRDKSGLRVWSNDGFGVTAADWVESQLK